ncbi:MAG TPA: glycoside hydrolase family 76 protein [Thermoleophilaceae bacterium]
MTRRLVLLAALALVLVPPGVAAAKSDRNMTRAVESYRALQKHLYLPEQRLYRGSPYSYVWPFSQAMSATIALAGMPRQAHHYSKQVRDRLLGLQSYFDPDSEPPGYDSGVRPPLGNGGAKLYDDNEWIGLEMLRRYRMTGQSFLLTRARTIFDLAVFGWDKDESHPCPGGVVFSQASTNVDRNTVTNAPGAELGLRLYELTENPYHLAWAKRMYSWVNRCLGDNSGFYLDHITFSGAIDPTVWTYNQGTMVGSNILLYRITGKKTYLKRARRLALDAMTYFTRSRLAQEPPPFVAIFFERLHLLDATRHDPAYRRYMQAWADRAWKRMRERRSGLFQFDPARSPKVLTQAGMTRMYANLAWPPDAFQ